MKTDNFESNVDYTTKLENFEGPLDLLLYLIKQAEIDIKDIFVSQVTDQFLQYVYNSKIEMEKESAYLSIATEIIEIKSKAIIPNEEAILEAEEQSNYLFRRIEEYKLYKESADKLKLLEDVNKFYKKPDESANDVKIVYNDFNLDGLVKAFTDLLYKVDFKENNIKKEKEIPKEVFTVADKMYFIKDKVLDKKEINFAELFTKYSTKTEIITTFQAMLELLKLQFIKVKQNETFNNITITLGEKENFEVGKLEEYN